MVLQGDSTHKALNGRTGRGCCSVRRKSDSAVQAQLGGRPSPTGVSPPVAWVAAPVATVRRVRRQRPQLRPRWPPSNAPATHGDPNPGRVPCLPPLERDSSPPHPLLSVRGRVIVRAVRCQPSMATHARREIRRRPPLPLGRGRGRLASQRARRVVRTGQPHQYPSPGRSCPHNHPTIPSERSQQPVGSCATVRHMAERDYEKAAQRFLFAARRTTKG